MGRSLSQSARRWARLTMQGLGFAPTKAGDAPKEAAALALAAWLPLGIIGVIHGLSVGAWADYFTDLAVHARFLVAVPLIHLASRGLVYICKASLRRLASEELGPATALSALEDRFGRWVGSRKLAGLLAFLAFLLGQAVFWEPIAGRTVLGESFARPDFLYRLWVTWVGLPIFYVVALEALHAFPDADIPVVQLSIHALRDFDSHFELGARLAPLRERGVLIVGSGNVVHNLRALEWKQPDLAFDWAQRLGETVRETVVENPANLPSIQGSEDYLRGHPTPEHFIPLLYLAGLADAAQSRLDPLIDGYAYGSLSMACYTLEASCPTSGDTRPAAPLPDPERTPASDTNV